MATEKKCANPVCSCVPAKGEKYCSAYCEGLHNKVVVMCHCGHDHCDGAA
jgi:hypothetical protein